MNIIREQIEELMREENIILNDSNITSKYNRSKYKVLITVPNI